MKQSYIASLYTSLCICLSIAAFGQTVADFESFELLPEEFLNGDDLSTGFNDGNIRLPNFYNTNYDSWTGWALSATTDTLTPGFTNQYSAITGKGVDASDAYAVRYDFAPTVINLTGNALGHPVLGLYVTNSTYAYLSIRDGDPFAKKFGGEDGSDPDYFLLTIKGFRDGSITPDSIDFYLADYRFSDDAEDYIIDDWTWIDCTPLGSVDSLVFDLRSTDVGQFGMNTPAYFCIDNVTTTDGSTSTEQLGTTTNITLAPNPVRDYLTIADGSGSVMIFSTTGELELAIDHLAAKQRIDISTLPTGLYILHLTDGEQHASGKFFKY